MPGDIEGGEEGDLFGALVVLDWGTDGLSGKRMGWWAALGALLFVVLVPRRVRSCF